MFESAMTSAHGANPVFFNKKNEFWTSRTLATPHPIRPTTYHFSLAAPPPPPQSGRHMYITPRLKIEEVLKQNLAEHLYKYFAMKTFDHLEQPFAGNELDNVLVNLEDYRQHNKFLI